MSVFTDVPSSFPLNVSLKSRPVAYRLASDGSERVAVVVLSLFWGLGVPALLFFLADPFAPWPVGSIAFDRAAALAGLIVFLVFGVGFWLWPNLQQVMRQVDVRITDTEIDVVESGLLGKRRWSKPISGYLGVAIENWGTRTVGNDKIPIAAVMLIHEDDRFSVPLHIDGAMRVKDRIAKGKAELLGLPLIDAPKFGVGAKAIAPGTIVANHAQALKVRVLYGVFGLAGVGAAMAASISFVNSGEVGYVALALLGIVLAGAMHLYASCYVTAMRSSGGNIEIITVVPIVGRRILPREDVREVVYREGRGGSGTTHTSHTPWVKIRTSNSRFPYIVDMQSDFVDEEALIQLGRKRKTT